MANNGKWYNVEIPYNTRVMIERVCNFREWLNDNNIKHDTSGAGDYVHFEVYATPDMLDTINNALDTIVWFDAIKAQ